MCSQLLLCTDFLTEIVALNYKPQRAEMQIHNISEYVSQHLCTFHLTKSSYILSIVHLGSTCSPGNLINLHSHMIEKHMILQNRNSSNSFLFFSVIILLQLQYITSLMIKVFIKGIIKAPNKLLTSPVEFTQFN